MSEENLFEYTRKDKMFFNVSVVNDYMISD